MNVPVCLVSEVGGLALSLRADDSPNGSYSRIVEHPVSRIQRRNQTPSTPADEVFPEVLETY